MTRLILLTCALGACVGSDPTQAPGPVAIVVPVGPSTPPVTGGTDASDGHESGAGSRDDAGVDDVRDGDAGVADAGLADAGLADATAPAFCDAHPTATACADFEGAFPPAGWSPDLWLGASVQQTTKKNETGLAFEAILPANPQDGGAPVAYATLTRHVTPKPGATRFTVSMRVALLLYEAPDHGSPFLAVRPMTDTFVTIGPASKTSVVVAVTLPGKAPIEPITIPWSVGDFRSVELHYDGTDAGGTVLRVVTDGLARGTVDLPPLDTTVKVVQVGATSYSYAPGFGSGPRTTQIDDVLVDFE